MNSLKEINIKNCTCYFFDDMISTKNLDPNKINIDEKLIRSITNYSDDYDKKYMKIKFHSDYDLPLKKTLKPYDMVIFVRSVFHEGNKYYLQVFLNKCLHKL